MKEKMGFTNKVSIEPKLAFEKKIHKENVVVYIFDHVVFAIDSTGKNYKELPELHFGTFDEIFNNDSLKKPDIKRDHITPDYVLNCLNEVVKDSSIHKFWFYPYGDDSIDKDTRSEARLRLFKRYFNTIESDPNNFGYIITI